MRETCHSVSFHPIRIVALSVYAWKWEQVLVVTLVYSDLMTDSDLEASLIC